MALLDLKCRHDGVIGPKCRRDGIARHKVYTRWLLNRVFETLHWYVYVDFVALVRDRVLYHRHVAGNAQIGLKLVRLRVAISRTPYYPIRELFV
jgi:hypothetical protein